MKLVRLIKMCLNGTYIKVHMGKYLSDNFPNQIGLQQGDDLSPLLFKPYFRTCNLEGPRKPGGNEIKWDTSASGLY
jgi:hypothetical protein